MRSAACGFCAVVLMAAVCSAWDEPAMHDLNNLDEYNTLVGDHVTREKGYCVHTCGAIDINHRRRWGEGRRRFDGNLCTDQNTGVIKVNSNDGDSDSAQLTCLEACRARSDATGCEVIWSQVHSKPYMRIALIEPL